MAGAPHLQKFLSAAKYFIGLKESGNNTFKDSRGRELWNLWGWNASGTPWCAIFVSACAQKAGIANKVIAKDSYAIGVQAKTVNKYGGKWIDGPLINGGKKVTPIPGDLITFGTASCKGHGHASHIGIVEYVEGSKVHTIEGNASNQCKRCSYSLSYSKINAYVRPDWSRVGDDISAYLAGIGETITLGPLYQNKNDRHDMTLRQVGYLDSTYALSNNTSGVAISVINYTSVLGDLYEMFAPVAMSNPTVSTSQLKGNTKIAMDYLLSKGFSASSASAITGCLLTYSNMLPTFSMRLDNGSYLFGIGAWNNVKLLQLKDRLGYEWNINLSGQLEFLCYDLETNFNTVLAVIKLQALNISNVEKVVDAFMSIYNSIFNTEAYKTEAKKNATTVYNSLIITQTQIIGGATSLVDKSGKALSAKYSVTIPSSVSQTGIIDDYTSYSAWFTRWAAKSPQRKLANLWRDQGYPCNKGIATIGGYYCVAVRPKFGSCGEVIVVTLEGGKSFPAIICDEKGSDAGSEWGHKKSGGKVSIIEWQRVKTQNGKVITGNIGFSNVDARGFSDWYGKKVMNITNYGKYVDVKWG